MMLTMLAVLTVQCFSSLSITSLYEAVHDGTLVGPSG